MNVTELMSKITVMLSGDRQTVVRAKFAELELVDGTKVMTEGELAVGSVLNVVAEDGTLTPAPAAMHEATDGTLVTVGENGIIEAIEEATPTEAAPAVEVEVDMEDVAVAADVAPEAIPATEALLQGIADIIAPFTEEIANLQEQVTALSAKFSDFSDEPAAKPIKRTFAESGAAKEVVAIARMERLAQIRNTKK